MLRALTHQGLIKNHFPRPSRLMLSNQMTDVEAIRKYPNLLQHGLETGLIYRLIFSIFWSNLYLFFFASTIFRFCCSNSSAERNASNSSPEKACWAAWTQWMLKQIFLKIKCFNNHIFRINLLLSCAGFFSKALPNNHEKMVIISMWCCEPLCTKGLRTMQNHLCENRQKKTIKSKKTRNLGLRLPISGPVFTMSEYGRLKFQRFSKWLEKVRDNYVSTPHLEQHHPITARCRVSASAQFKSCRTHSAAASVSLLCLISIWITRLSQLQRRNLLFCRLLW